MGKNFLSIIVVILFAVIAGFSLLKPGLPPTHDGEYHVVRFFLFDEALKDGSLYPRWAAHLNNGFGIPLFNFVYPLPNYAASILRTFNVGFIDSFKISMLLASIIGAIFFYLWSKKFWGELGGIVSSTFYTFSPYHFVDIYIRGSVGEVWALGFFPAFLWAYTEFVKSKRKKFLILSSMFLALIVFSHNILALMFFFFSLSYIVFLICMEKNKKYLIFNTFYLILLGLGFSAIFWLPAIYETKYVTGLQVFDAISHFPDLYQLLIPSWGSGFSGGGLQNELSYQIGAANLLAVFLSLIVVFFQMKRKEKKIYYSLFFLSWFIIVLFLMLEVSRFVWQSVPFMNYFQFPWRFLSLEILFSSFLAGSIFSLNIKSKFVNFFFAIFLIFTVFILGIGYTKPAYYLHRNDGYYITRSNFIDGTNSPGNVFNTIFLKSIPVKERQRAVFLGGKGEIISTKAKSNAYSFAITAFTNSEIQVNLAYFPGWEVYVNNEKKSLKFAQNGRFTFFIPAGKNKVEIVLNDTPIRRISALIFLVSLGLMITLLINRRFATIKR